MPAKVREKQKYFVVLLVFLALAFVLVWKFGVGPKLHPGKVQPSHFFELPLLTFYSFLRMLGAYVLAVIFSLVYGYYAGTSKRLEKILVPLLDILQSVPVLGFFPAAIYFFVSIFHHSHFGVELASIFLIFTSQAWNMAFGVYETMVTLPKEAIDALDSLNIRGWLRYRKFYLPSAVPKLVYNSIMSWAGGWYILTACELIAVGQANYALAGIGSFLFKAAEAGSVSGLSLGLLTLVSLITLLHLVVWRPLTIWAEKFRYEFTVSTVSTNQPAIFSAWRNVGGRLHYLHVPEKVSSAYSSIIGRNVGAAYSSLRNLYKSHPLGPVKRVFRRVVQVAMVLAAAYLIFEFAVGLYTMFKTPIPKEAANIPLAILFSTLRLIVAFMISLLWTVPVSVWIGENERVSRVLMPVIEIAASIPATALFPVVLLFFIKTFGGMNIAAIVLILTGMQWYIIFNLVAGVRNIPGDLKEVAVAFGMNRRQYWFKVLLPAMMPSLITGSITGWGGGWNALIVSEYVVFGGTVYSVMGIGALLDKATYQLGSQSLIVLSVVSLVLFIVLINRLFWRKMYKLAAEKYKIEY